MCVSNQLAFNGWGGGLGRGRGHGLIIMFSVCVFTVGEIQHIPGEGEEGPS